MLRSSCKAIECINKLLISQWKFNTKSKGLHFFFCFWEITFCYFNIEEINRCVSINLRVSRIMQKHEKGWISRKCCQFFFYIYIHIHTHVLWCVYIYKKKIKVVMSVNKVTEIKLQTQPTWYTKKKHQNHKTRNLIAIFSILSLVCIFGKKSACPYLILVH